MPSEIVASMQKLAKSPPTDEKEKKDLYNAAMDLLYSVESKQDTQQRLYHGVSQPMPYIYTVAVTCQC